VKINGKKYGITEKNEWLVASFKQIHKNQSKRAAD